MKKKWLLLLVVSQISCAHKTFGPGPYLEKKAHSLTQHGDVRVDDYHWLKERENPQVLDYLKSENKYTAEAMKPVKALEESLFLELKGRLKEDDSTVPAKDGEYYYSVRYELGQQYPLYVRTKGSLKGPEEILLNVPELAKPYSFYKTTGPQMSVNHKLMAFGVDTVGRRFYTLFFKDLERGKLLPDKIENVTGNLVWANDNKTAFYSEQNPKTLRSEKIYRYDLETHQRKLVYFEPDETFSVEVYKSLSEKFIYIMSYSTMTSEVRFVDANKPIEKFRIFAPRTRGHEYSVTDGRDLFYILTNKDAKNFKVMSAEIGKTDVALWKEVIPHRPDVFIQNLHVFKNYLVMDERKKGLTQIHITDRLGQNSFNIPFADESYLANVGDNRQFDSEWLRFDYESMRLPLSVYDINLKTRQQELKKTREVPNYQAELYKTERIFIEARDGAQVPVSLLMKKDHQKNGQAPMLLYGYGSYGANMDPWFSSHVFSLVDRGFVYAIAHIRGGSEMGREWYEKGRTGQKKNTFTDFIDCTEALVKGQYAHPKKVFAMGGSAGGLLMGAIMNLRADLYQGVIAQVPFVDVLTTMLDNTIPLTTAEYDEWGNPNEKEAYEYIKSYSPYDNVKSLKYPHTLVTAGLHDSQVQYWEPAKWVAKLRAHNRADSLILLKTNMEAGHGGASGRYDRLKEKATEYAFILMTRDR